MNGLTVGALADFSSHRIEGFLEQTGTNLSVSLFSQIENNLWMGGCPAGIAPLEFQFIVCLYTSEEYRTHAHQIITRARLMDTNDLPDERRLFALARQINDYKAIGPTLVHCQAGLNRSGLLIGLSLVLSGWTPGAAIALMREQRCGEVLCNKRFERWLREQRAVA